ncbi:uncharacterized protein Z520_00365 [Fonsecaea multimorphosa CBS 102226]|uniref:Monooxygenase n=1 Tax=Fonsecaea multimorphosa CBS 102226 TaxID=1442371 RepID=A0A0D2L3P8_9EURO|nr:uncharacterized protein Z520_00365 [Fonsecaea multimorphosa CBS 102226]KIY03674.1 hypothetical protein Z520_00365 [Fonsecaea multimorphosa CBS 102226]OAL32373.1 hypothetical protein AYO22_00395 [Fonsecaea multimorphosa]
MANPEPRLIIIGGGVAAIALGVKLKTQLGFKNFIAYEKEAGIGGVWRTNTYPGVGCDVDSHLYSFSFNLNPNWSRRFADQREILQYMEDTVDKFDIRDHFVLNTKVVEAAWIEEEAVWEVQLVDLETEYQYSKKAEFLVSGCGVQSYPKPCDIPGYEKFKGAIWHSARWNHDYNLKGRRVAVIGNGCSAAQLVPYVVNDAAYVYQFQRSPQWINERPNKEFSAFQKLCFKYLPLWQRLYRFYLWKTTDALHELYTSDTKHAVAAREAATRETIAYMKKMAPAKYHKILIPDFPLGCKRRVFNPGWLECLHSPNLELTTERIIEITETGLRTSKRTIDVDAIVLSTGYNMQEFLSPIKLTGRNGKTLSEHWKETRGAQAYKGTFVSGFPNFGIVFGPNAFPAHNSVIYTDEVQVEFIIKTVIQPVLAGHFKVIDIKDSAETLDANHVQRKLQTMVWSANCVNWNRDGRGRNTTNYFDTTWMFWYRLYWPVWKDYTISGGRGTHPIHPLWKLAASVLGVGCLAEVAWHFSPALVQSLSALYKLGF